MARRTQITALVVLEGVQVQLTFGFGLLGSSQDSETVLEPRQ